MGLAPDHSPASFVETQGTLSNGAVTIAANPNRRGLIIGNASDTAMTFRVGATATAAAGVPIPAVDNVALYGEHCPSGSISLFCAGTTKAYTIYEWSR